MDTLSYPLPKRQVGRFVMGSLVVALFLLVFPVRSSWNDYRAQQTGYEEVLATQDTFLQMSAEARAARQNVPIMTREIQAMEPLLERRTRRLRTINETAGIQEEVRDLALTRGLENFSLSRSTESEQEGYKIRSFQLSAEGTFRQLLRFLNEVRSMDTVIQLGQVTISGSPDPNRTRLVMSAILRFVLVESEIDQEGIHAVLNDSTWARSISPLPEEAGPPAVSEPDPARPDTVSPEPLTAAAASLPVRLEGFEQLNPGPGVIEIRLRLTKSDWDGSLQRGYVVALVEDRTGQGSPLVYPPMGVREGRPADPRAGDPFAVSRYKPLLYRFETPTGFVAGAVRLLVYDEQGDLILEDAWQEGPPAGGRSGGGRS
jgi:Tfp pilus assembly protein PilO